MYNQILLLYSICVCLHQDLKDARRRDDLAAARATLKKNSMMLLTTSKVIYNEKVAILLGSRYRTTT